MTKARKSLFASVSVLALGLGANGAMAADPVDQRVEQAHQMSRTLSGNMGIYLGTSFNVVTDDSTSLENYFSIGGDAKADIPFSENFGIQFDIYGEGNLSVEATTSEDYIAGFLAGVHANYREPESYLLGIFAGVGTVANGESSSGAARQFLGGIEGQYHSNNWTFYGQGGIATAMQNDTNNTDWIDNGLFVRGVVRKYFNGGDGKLAVDALYIAGDMSSGDVDGFAWGVEAEHLLRDYGTGFVTGFARYEGYSFEEDWGRGTDNSSAHVFKLGIKVNFGYDNPYARDHYGAGVDFADMSRIHSLIRALE